MADAVLSVEVRAKLEALSRGLKDGEKSIEDFVSRGDRHISKIESRFASLGKSTKEISDNIKSALGGMSFEKFFQDVASGKDVIAQSKVEVQKYKEEIERLKKVSQDITNQIKEKTKALNDSKIATENQRTATEAERTESVKLKNENQKLKNELQALRNEKAKNTQQTKAATGSYREAQQRLTALGKIIRENANGFDLNNKAVRTQVAEYNNLNNKLKEFDRAMGNHYRNVGNYSSALSSLSPQLSMLAGRGGGLLAVAVAAREAYKTVSTFDSGMRDVEKTTGLSRKEVDALGKEFVNLSRRLQTISANDLTQYATIAGQLGVKGTRDITAFTEALAKLETATNISGEQGGAEIARTLTLIEGGVKNVKLFGDEIVNLGNNFAATEKEILSNAESIAQNTAIYGFGRQEVLAFATATKSLGVEAEVVGSTFQKTLGTFEKAIRTGKGLDEILQVIGGSAEDLQARFKVDASGVFQDYIKGLNGIQKAGGSVMAQMEKNGIQDIRQRRVIGTLATGYDTLARSMDTVRDAAGALDQEFEVKAGSMANQTGRIKVAWDNLILSIEQGTGVIGTASVAFADMTATMLDGITKVVTSRSWNEFFARIGGMSGNNAVSFAANAMGDIAKMQTDSVGGNKEGLVPYNDMKDFYRMTEAQQKKELIAQEKLLKFSVERYNQEGKTKKLRDELLYQAEKLAKMREKVIKPDSVQPNTSTTVGSEKDIEKQIKSLNAYANAQRKLEKILLSSYDSLNKREVDGIKRTILAINQKYDGWKRQATEAVRTAGDASDTIAKLEVNRKEETQKAIDAMIKKSLEERQEAEVKSARDTADKVAKVKTDAISIDLVYQRRFNETALQRDIKMINAEYKKLEKELENTLKSQIAIGVEITPEIMEARGNALQADMYKDIEKAYTKNVEIEMALVDGRNKFNEALERTNIIIRENERAMAAIDLDSVGGREQLEMLKQQNEQLRYQQDILSVTQQYWQGINATLSDSLVTAVMEGERFIDVFGEGMKSVFSNIIKSLIEMGVQILINKALSIGSIGASSKAGTAATAANTVASVAAAKVTAAAWATPAALVSAATFGASAGTGAAALSGAVGAANALAMLTGFASGGYTGNMGVNEPAGIVHGKEFVFDAKSTQRLGVENLKALQTGKIPTVSDFTPRIAKNSSNFNTSNAMGGRQSLDVNVRVAGDISNNTIHISGKRAERFDKKFGRG